MILTKSDLADNIDDPVDGDMLKGKVEADGYQGYALTSSKEWEDFNVHKAFNKTLMLGLKAKYEM